MEIISKFNGLFGIIIILFICFLMSNNKKKINYKTVGVGLLLQFILAVFIMKTPLGVKIFGFLAILIDKILNASIEGSNFVFGWLSNSPEKISEHIKKKDFIFALILMSTMILILVIVNILYYYGIMQRVILILGKIMNKILGVSGAEALSNCASPFVGNVAAQSLIKHYLPNMTRSEMLAIMTGSMACISASCIAMYTGFKFIGVWGLLLGPIVLIILKNIYGTLIDKGVVKSILER